MFGMSVRSLRDESPFAVRSLATWLQNRRDELSMFQAYAELLERSGVQVIFDSSKFVYALAWIGKHRPLLHHRVRVAARESAAPLRIMALCFLIIGFKAQNHFSRIADFAVANRVNVDEKKNPRQVAKSR